jgi:hypothetical protein
MTSHSRMQHIRDALLRAMRTREISPDGPDLYQLSSDLIHAQFPEANEATPKKLCAFSLLVGFAAGSAIQKFEDEVGR